MQILLAGCNHRTAPLAIREQLAFPPDAARQAMRELLVCYPQSEALLLSTCNRVELYVARPAHGPPSAEQLLGFLARWHNVEPEELERVTYRHAGRDAAGHLLTVAASLDSMVVGETQILGQVRDALQLARQAGAVGPVLTRLAQDAIAAARRIHAETDLSAGRASIASVAVQLAQQIFATLGDKTVLLIGAGKMGEQVARRVIDLGPKRVLTANRTAERAEELAGRLGGQAISLAELDRGLAQADIVISSTGSPAPLVTAEMVRAAMKARRFRPIFFIDIAVPRDIEPEAGDVPHVYLYNIDDLQRVVESAMNGREQHVERARRMIEEAADAFMAWLHARSIGPTIEAFTRKLADLRSEELAWLLPKLSAGATDRDRELIEQFAHRLLSKLMHDPVSELTSVCGPDGAADAYAQALAQLFKLDVEDKH